MDHNEAAWATMAKKSEESIQSQCDITLTMLTLALSPTPHPYVPNKNNIIVYFCTLLDQRRRRCAHVAHMLYKCFVFAGSYMLSAHHEYNYVTAHREIKPSHSIIMITAVNDTVMKSAVKIIFSEEYLNF